MLGYTDIRDYSDLVTLGLASTLCIDELLEIKNNDSYDANKKREGLEILKDSFDVLIDSKKTPENLRYLVFVKYQEVFVLRKYFRDRKINYDYGIENISLSLERILSKETNRKQRFEDSKKLIDFFHKIGVMCVTYSERPPLELMPGYVPVGLVGLKLNKNAKRKRN